MRVKSLQAINNFQWLVDNCLHTEDWLSSWKNITLLFIFSIKLHTIVFSACQQNPSRLFTWAALSDSPAVRGGRFLWKLLIPRPENVCLSLRSSPAGSEKLVLNLWLPPAVVGSACYAGALTWRILRISRLTPVQHQPPVCHPNFIELSDQDSRWERLALLLMVGDGGWAPPRASHY